MKKIAMRVLFYVTLSILAVGSGCAEAPPVRVLLITGQNNHKWEETTPIIVELLDATARFEVESTEKIEAFPPERLDEFDVILSNWNLWKYRKDMPAEFNWSPELKEAYVDFVKNGKGHVVLHAGSSTFFDWEDYQELCVATWMKGTHHGPQHEFEVRIDVADHPVTKGLSNFKKWDELWEKVYVSSEGATVLASSYASKEFKGDDVWEQNTFVSKFGEGRTAYTSLGHDARAFESKEFKALLARLVEWAATGEVTIPAPGE